MDAVLDYSYDSLTHEFNSAKDNLSNRAVRVKMAVKEKIRSNFTVPGIETQISEAKEEKTVLESTLPNALEDDILSYKTEENIAKLETKIQTLEAQKTVVANANRAVLYTKSLIEKNEKVFNTWFKGKTVEEATVVPDTWDLPVSAVETVSEETKEVEEPVVNTQPVAEEEPKTETVEEPVMEKEIPVEPPKFDFSMPTWNNEEENIVSPPEPVDIPAVKVDLPLNDSYDMDTNEGEKEFDLSSILNKPMFDFGVKEEKTEEPNELESAFSMPTYETRSSSYETRSEDEIPSKTAIMARVKRASGVINEKNAKISDLEGKISNMDKSISDMREKVNSYETVTRDLAKANNSLTSENEQLKQKVSELNERYATVVEESDRRMARDKQQHAEELSSLRTTIESLKEQHQREKDEISSRYEKRLSDSEKHHKTEMKALWSSISSALGESVMDEEQEHKRVA